MKKLLLFAVAYIFTHGVITAQCTSCDGSINTGTNASAIGTETEATGHSAFSSGVQSIANASYTTAIGFHAEASYTKAIAIGSTIRTTGYQSITLGSGEFNTGSYLTNNISRSLMVGFNSIYPTLFVVGNTDPQYHNKTGRIGIGNVTTPQAKLHIRSDDNEPATLFLQPSNWNANYNAALWLADSLHSISAEIDEGLVYKTEENHVFKGGNIYIEDIDKGIIMKSPDGRCWLGKLDNNGILNFTVMETCPGQPSAIYETGETNTGGGLHVYPNPANDYLTVEFHNPDHKLFSVALIDEQGVELRFSKTTAEKTQIFTGDLKKGLYIVSVSGNGRKLTDRVIK